jgi:choline-glycine betaine transporter
MILCGVCVSCSGLLKKDTPIDASFVPTLPIVIPVLCALIMPICVVLQQAAQKYITNYLHISADDFGYGYFLLFSTVLQIMAIIKFSVDGHYD